MRFLPAAAKRTARAVRAAASDLGRRWRVRGQYRPDPGNRDLETHLRSACAWLERAQDAGSDRGISWGAPLGGGFLGSYPETTGYIIPTWLDLARHWNRADLADRAVQAGDWEIAIQMPEGAVMAGIFNHQPVPALFNTGQVLFGWVALAAHTGEARFREAARRAASWMLAVQSPDGSWRVGQSPHARAGSTLYNVRAAWGLYEAGLLLDWPQACQAALRNAAYTLMRQRPNGWFEDCCLSDPERPLMHTLVYAMEGLAGLGERSGREDLQASVGRAADSLLPLAGPDGFLPGRVDSAFRPAVSWCCLTGAAQLSTVLFKLHQRTGRRDYLAAALRLNAYLMDHHDLASPSPAIRGGLAGSWPLWGEYGKFQVLNWAAKFFLDALLCQARGAALR